jgi:hypothetical protein
MNPTKCFLIQSVFLWICFPVISFSQPMQPELYPPPSEDVKYYTGQQSKNDTFRIEPNKGLKINGSFSFGTGGEKLKLGETTEGDAVTLRTAGGYGMAITLGYNFFSKVDFDLTAGYQLNWIRPECDNLDGYFSRVPLLVTLKYWIPTKNNAFFKLGGGLGFYTSVKYDADGSESFGVHEIIKYDNATGFHIVGEYEIISPVKPVGFVLGLKYYYVNYNAKSVTSNGTSLPVSDILPEFRSLKGSGFDFYFGFGWYF